MILLPAAAEAFVERDELLANRDLGRGILLLEVILLALGVDDVEEIGQPSIIALRREAHCALTGRQRFAQIAQTILL